MKPTPQAIENAARNIYTATPRNRPYGQLSLAKKNALRAQATKVLTGDLGDMVLVPKEALAWLFGEGPDADGHWFEPPEIKKGERKKPYWWRSRSRAMLAAAEDSNDQG